MPLHNHVNMDVDTIVLAFITGLTSGGISCMAVQGGLLASALTNQNENTPKSVPVAAFLASKLVAYTILGLLLGAVGSALSLTPSVQGWMQIAAGVFMLLTVGRMLNIHPIFRHFAIQPPKSIYKLLKGKTKDETVVSAGVLGFLTVLIPCGITQGMIVYAIASGNALSGASIMFAYTLGTSPVFFALGVSAAHLMKRKGFTFVTACLILVLGLMSINTGQVVRGSVHTFQNYSDALASTLLSKDPVTIATVNTEGVQEVTINVTSRGYNSSVDSIKTGVPTRLKLVTNDTLGCSRAFTIPKLNYQVMLPLTGEEIVEFTPEKAGVLSYTCSMGMYSGRLQII